MYSELYQAILSFVCAGQDSNLRSPKAIDLQSIAIDRSATGATGAVYQKIETGTTIPLIP